jgi:adenylate cyclase class IV
MIEVEKKFQPTEDELEALLEGAEFLGEIENYDEHYDYPDFRLFKKGFRLRNRNGKFELKIKGSDFASGTTNSEEIETEPEILEKLGFGPEAGLADIISAQMEVFAAWRTKRKKYKKGRFNIDVDKTDFGYNVCEIEVMVEDPQEAERAEREITNLAREAGFPLEKLPTKMREYLKVAKPEIYQELYKFL